MKTDDIFEAITDIDDKFITEARPTDLNDDQSAIAYPAVKKPLWKTLVPAAACVAALAAAGAFGVKYLRGRGVQPGNSTVSSPASLNELLYPEEAKYIVDKDITRFNCTYEVVSDRSHSIYDDTAEYAQSYDELAAQSDLIVAGTFIDFLHQTQDYEEIHVHEEALDLMSYNMLEVDRVFKGDVKDGNVLMICQHSMFGAGAGKGDIYNVFIGDQLSPMLKGDKWIYFLKKDENGIYSPVNGPQGRYPLPNYTNTFITADGSVACVDKFSTYDNTAPARDRIYDKLLNLFYSDTTDVEQISLEENSTFTMPEFPDKTFKIAKHNNIVMSDKTTPGAMIRPVISGIEYYLTDLNGDGKREICSWGSIGSGIVSSYILVYDIANDEFYYYDKAERPFDKWFSLDVKDGVLYAVTTDFYDDDKEISRVPLSLDILEKVTKSDTAYEEIPLCVDQTFTMNDFPGIEFTVDLSFDYPSFRFGWGSYSVANNVTRVYLCDIDGDGKREICLNCPFTGNGIIRVYGFMDNGEMGEAVYFEDGGCWLDGGEDGTLMYYTNDKIEQFKFSKSDLNPSLAQDYSYVVLSWDHTVDFSGIEPVFSAYNVSIKNRTLKIKCKGDVLFDSGIQLSDLYYIHDTKNHTLIFVYATGDVGGDDGMVGAIRLSENSAERYDFEKGVSIKPTTNELLLVKADGREVPFEFPEDSSSLLQ